MGQDATAALTTWSLSRCRDPFSVVAFPIPSQPHDTLTTLKSLRPLQSQLPAWFCARLLSTSTTDSPSRSWQAQLQPRRLAGARCFIQWWDQLLVHKEAFQSKAAAPSSPWPGSRSHCYPITRCFGASQHLQDLTVCTEPLLTGSILSTVFLINRRPHVPRTVWYRFSVSIH